MAALTDRERELVPRARQGDRDAFEQLVLELGVLGDVAIGPSSCAAELAGLGTRPLEIS